MSVQEMFAVLKITETKEEQEIRRAYLELLKYTNPEDDPEGFKRLRGAYEEALLYARTPEESEGVTEAKWMEESGPTAEVLRRLADVYGNLPKRIDEKEWRSLASHPVFQSLDEGETAKWGMFSYLAEHYRLPCTIWQLLDELFFIRENEQEFREHLPDGFVDFILYKVNDENQSSDFPYEKFEGDPEADYDRFIERFVSLMNEENGDTPESLERIWQGLEGLAALGISHPWYDLEKVRYRFRKGETEEAEREIRELMELHKDDDKILMTGAGILLKCGCYEDAGNIYEAYLERDDEDRNASGNYTAMYGLGKIAAEEGNWEKARRYASDAREYQITEEVQELLSKANEELIARYLERADSLTEEEADLLGWCFINSGKAEEGQEFFAAHPEYKKDTLKWHKMTAVLYMSSGKPEDSIQEGRLWREKVEQELTALKNGADDSGKDGAPAETADRKTADGTLAEAADHETTGHETADHKTADHEAADHETADHEAADHETADAMFAKPKAQLERKEEEEHLKQDLAKSYHLEGRCLRNIWQQKREAEEQDQEELEDLFNRAQAAHDKAIELEPDNVDFRMHKMTMLRDKKEYQAVVDQCEQILAIDDEFFWACAYMQEAYEGLRMAQEVVDTFYRAKAIYAGNEEIYLRALRVFRSFDQYEDALNIIRQAEEAGVDSVKLMVEKIGILDHVVDDEESWQEADDFAKAVIERLESEETPPELMAEAYLKRAYLNDSGDKKVQNKELKLDKELAEKSLALNDTVAARYYLGRYYIEHGKDPKKAYEHLKICEERGMDYEWMFFYIAQCHEKFREWDKAIEYYKRVAEENPEFSDCYWRIGWLYRTKFSRTLQKEYAEKALYYINLQGEKFGEIPDHFRRRAFIYLRLGEFETALKEIEKAIEGDQDCGMWYQKGQILKAMGRYDEAVECFEKSIQSKDRYAEDNESCYDRIFQCFLRQKRYDEGIAYFEKALKTVKEDGERDKCLYSLENLEGDRGKVKRCLYWIKKRFGDVNLTKRVNDSWKKEADRIEDIMDVCLVYQDCTEAEIRKKCNEAAILAGIAMADTEGDCNDRALVCQNVGEAYYALGDFAQARIYLEQAKSLADQVEEYDCPRSLQEYLMKTYYWLGETELAKEAGTRYRRETEKDYDECTDLDIDLETMLTRPSMESKQLLYRMFCWAYFTGQPDKAREYGEMMEQRKMCWWCDEAGCTELWEVKGYMALMNGETENAMKAFELSDKYCWLGGCREARMMMRRLKKENDSI